MNYLKVARFNQISVDLDGNTLPLCEEAFKKPEATITINDDEVGLIKVSLIKNHNDVLLLRAKPKDHAHLVFCVNLRSLTRANNVGMTPVALEDGEYAHRN